VTYNKLFRKLLFLGFRFWALFLFVKSFILLKPILIMHLLKDLGVVFIILMALVFIVDFVSSFMTEEPVHEQDHLFNEAYCRFLLAQHLSEEPEFVNSTTSFDETVVTTYIANSSNYIAEYKVVYEKFRFNKTIPFCGLKILSETNISGARYQCGPNEVLFSKEKTRNYLLIIIQFSREGLVRTDYTYMDPRYEADYEAELMWIKSMVDDCTLIE
jgi:hypothetical protein